MTRMIGDIIFVRENSISELDWLKVIKVYELAQYFTALIIIIFIPSIAGCKSVLYSLKWSWQDHSCKNEVSLF